MTSRTRTLLLCDHHHHRVHQPGWIVKFDGHETHFIGPMGIEIRGPGPEAPPRRTIRSRSARRRRPAALRATARALRALNAR